MKEKPVFPLLVSMALPMVISMLVNSLYNIVDSFFVAQISEDAMTALSLVYPVQNFVNAVAIGFGIGLNAVISYYLGAGDNPKPVNTVAEGNFTDNKEHNRVNSHTQQAGQIVFGKGHGYSQKSDRQNKFNQWMNLVHPLVLRCKHVHMMDFI